MDGEFTNSDHVINGEMRIGMQDHFYMETQSAHVNPGGEHGEFEVFTANQSLHESQVLNLKLFMNLTWLYVISNTMLYDVIF